MATPLWAVGPGQKLLTTLIFFQQFSESDRPVFDTVLTDYRSFVLSEHVSGGFETPGLPINGNARGITSKKDLWTRGDDPATFSF